MFIYSHFMMGKNLKIGVKICNFFCFFEKCSNFSFLTIKIDVK